MTLLMPQYKKPVSVLVVIHDGHGFFLLLRRTDGENLWQSVTGSVENEEKPYETALREVYEETGILATQKDLHDWHIHTDYTIFPRWRHRYAPGTTRNREHLFSLSLPKETPIQLNPREHLEHSWLSADKARRLVFSPSNAKGIALVQKSVEGITPF